jgi:predicted DNA-binding transcriptional regulator YafY
MVRIESTISWVTEETWVTLAPLTAGDGDQGQILIQVPYLSKEWLIRWILSMGGAAALLDPPEIAREIHEIVTESAIRLRTQD